MCALQSHTEKLYGSVRTPRPFMRVTLHKILLCDEPSDAPWVGGGGGVLLHGPLNGAAYVVRE